MRQVKMISWQAWRHLRYLWRKGGITGRGLALILTLLLILTLAPIAAATASVDTGNYSDIVPQTVHDGLTEVFARLYYGTNKPLRELQKLSNGNTNDWMRIQPEVLHFNDIQYGTHIWRLGNNAVFPTGQTIFLMAHNTINRSPWNIDGSVIGVFSCQHGYDYVWPALRTANEFVSFTMDSDGGNFGKPPRTGLNSGSAYIDSTRTAHFVWDRFDPHLCYWAGTTNMWCMDITNAGPSAGAGNSLTAVAEFTGEHALRTKNIFSYPTEDNVIMAIDEMPGFDTYGNPEFIPYIYIIDLKKPYAQRVQAYPFAQNISFPQNHDENYKSGLTNYSIEYRGAHDIYFTRGVDHSYIWNYGPRGSVGEYIFYMAVEGIHDKDHIKLYFPGSSTDPTMTGAYIGNQFFGSSVSPYFSHPGFSAQGKYVAYYGLPFSGGPINALQVADAKTGEHILTVTQDGGGHLAYDANDDNIIVSSFRNADLGDTQVLSVGTLYREDGSKNTVNNAKNLLTTYTHGEGSYNISARPALSPDGTKVFYHSSMIMHDLSVASGNDSYVAVARYPFPAANLRGSGSILSWDRHRFRNGYYAAETKYYHVFMSSDNMSSWQRANTSGIVAGLYINGAIPPVQPGPTTASFNLNSLNLSPGTYYFGVITEEHSGLQSEQLSNIVRVVYNGSTYAYTDVAVAPARDFDQTTPAPIGAPRITEYYNNPRHEPVAGNPITHNYCWNKLEWDSSPPADDVWYYNIYYSVEGIPEPKTARLIASVPASYAANGKVSYVDWQARPDVGPNDHYYFITAVNHQLRESSAVVRDEYPLAPTGLRQVGASSHDAATIAWNASAIDAAHPTPDGYNIYINDNLLAFVPAAANLQYNISKLKPETTYEIYVKAVINVRYESPASNRLSVTTTSDPSLIMYAPRANLNFNVASVNGDIYQAGKNWVVDEPLLKKTGNTGNTSVYCGLMWDDDYLYVAGRAFDASPSGDDGGKPPYEVDSFDVHVNGSGERNSDYGSGDIGDECITNMNRLSSGFPAGTVSAVKHYADGWSFEMAIPWNYLNRAPQDGVMIGFDTVYNDAGPLTGRTGRLAWNSDESWYSPATHGRVFLKTTATGAAFSGAILYQPSPRPARVELYNSAGTQVAFADTAADGAYTLIAPAGAGYTLVITKPGYLSYTIKNLTLREGEELETIDMHQMGGDINGDGYINSEDLVCLISEYGGAPVNYPLADIDGDGLVNSVDLTCLLAGYGRWNVVVERLTIND